ncbi:SDR family oxidoreductase [Enterovibrio sp. Hal110]
MPHVHQNRTHRKHLRRSREAEAWLQSNIKLDRVGEVEDLMGAVLYLASSASGMVTGTSLKVDGGWTAE